MLTFIDESGYPRPTDSTKNPILLGVCIHENDIKPITNQIYKLKDSIYGKQDEIKSTKLIREATITKNRTNNKAYVEGMVDIITSYDAAIFAIIMDKPDEPIIVPEHHLPKQYYLLLKKVEFYCNHHHYGKAMMIFDEVHEDADRKIAEAITGFLFKTKFGRSFHHILEMPLFVSSAVTPAVQFADIFAAIASGYTRILQGSANTLKDLQGIINPSDLSMTDKDRLDVVDKTYAELLRLRNLTSYYTRQNLSVSYIRARKSNDMERTLSLYGTDEDKYW